MIEFIITTIARTAHEVNRAYCECIGDDSQVPWNDAPNNIQASAINGVRFHIENPGVTPEQSHDNWSKFKINDGWSVGDVKCEVNKTHPCLVPYDQLPFEQKVKDHLFKAIVTNMTPVKL